MREKNKQNYKKKGIKMMKRTLFYTLLCAILLGITACSQKDDVEANPDGKVDLAKGLQIKLNFTDYNEDIKVDGTRAVANDTLRREWVDLGNGMSAEVTVKRDTTKSKAKASTRVISDGTYTLLAYDHTTHNLVGEITGQVVSGTFTPSAGFDVEPNKTYDFVCYNSKVTRNGNILTVTKANAEYARIGRTTQFIPNSLSRQWISFNMKPAASRLSIRLESWVEFPALTATLATNTGQTVPSTAQYDMSTDTWATGTGVANSENLTFPAPNSYYGDPASSSQYIYYLPSTDIGKLKLTLHGSGKLYNLPVEGANLLLNSLKDGAGLVTTMQPTYSYAVSVKLVYNYLYLMSDGTTGLFKATTFGGGSRTPVGIVVSRGKHLAMSIKQVNTNSSDDRYWLSKTIAPPSYPSYGNGYNTTMYAWNDVNALKDMKGYEWTWDAASSWDGATVKANSLVFPAFYMIGHHTTPINGHKWFLPSAGQWVEVVYNLCFADRATTPLSQLNDNSSTATNFCNTRVLAKAVNAVGGDSWENRTWPYQSSTEWDNRNTCMWPWNEGKVTFRPECYTCGAPPIVVPFIIYQ